MAPVALTATNYTNTRLVIVCTYCPCEGARAGTAKICTVSMTANRSVTAVFVSFGN